MIDERDELIERVARALSPLPPKNAHAKAQILAAVRPDFSFDKSSTKINSGFTMSGDTARKWLSP